VAACLEALDLDRTTMVHRLADADSDRAADLPSLRPSEHACMRTLRRLPFSAWCSCLFLHSGACVCIRVSACSSTVCPSTGAAHGPCRVRMACYCR
jgi:hypothetical protein